MYLNSYNLATLRVLNELAVRFYGFESADVAILLICERLEEMRRVKPPGKPAHMRRSQSCPTNAILEETATYLYGCDDSGVFIQCKICDGKSHHPDDAREKYCAGCKQFHSILQVSHGDD